MDFENELDAFKEKTRAMCDAMDCRELLNDYLVEIEVCRPTYYHFYEAGQQSKQAEIDELQRRINNALNEIESGITGKHHVKSIIKILKGE